jgi:hypothetical protein
MAGTNDISIISLDDNTLKKLREFAKENLSRQQEQGLLLVIFAAKAGASQEVDTTGATDVDQLLGQLREAYMPGNVRGPIRCCIVPPPPVPVPGNGNGNGNGNGPGTGTEPYSQ